MKDKTTTEFANIDAAMLSVAQEDYEGRRTSI
jgi:hypothetical protein